MQKLHRAISIVLSFAAVMFYIAIPAQAAGLMRSAKVVLDDPRQATGAKYTFTATMPGGKTIKGIKIAFRTAASSGSEVPQGLNLNEATNVSDLSNLTAGWATDRTDKDTGVLYIAKAAGDAIGSNTVVSWSVSAITNPNIAANVGCTPKLNDLSAGTCFVRVTTFDTEAIDTMRSETSSNIVDTVTLPFEVTAAVTVSAKVDPALTFVVAGVALGQNANGSLTSAASDYNTLPFGNLATNTPKYLAHDLTVKTNAVNGYTVSIKMYSQMTGSYGASNNIDPFVANKDSNASWASPANWATPNGTVASADTGWIGAHTNNSTVNATSNLTQFTAGKWGPVQSDQANNVMYSTSPDLGNNATRVSYALEVNVYQPSDSYSGVLVYNAIPTY